MQYEYTEADRIKSPHYYMYTPYHGLEFMRAYNENRMGFIGDGLPLEKEALLQSMTKELEQFKGEGTASALSLLARETLSGENHEDARKKLSPYVAKFEVSKKLFTEYTSAMKPASDKHRDIAPYAVLAFACGAYYLKNGNLKFLNVLLKLSDLLVSCSPLIKDEPLLSICRHAVAAELIGTRMLSSKKEVPPWY
jgi:hypothetical protein